MEFNDQFPNQVHGNYLNRFLIQQARDKKKRKISEKNEIVLIIIKDINGFDRYNLSSIQDEIINQFKQKTNILLKKSYAPIPSFISKNFEKNE